MKRNGDTLIHLEFKQSGTHLYFGSLAAIYDTFDAKVLRVSLSRLWAFKVTEDRPYSNKTIIVRKGAVHRKSGRRKNPNNFQ